VQDQVPGVFLKSRRRRRRPSGATGRLIDHIGFEVKNLEAFTKM
jgi:hypothetical protein